ncbi:YARHG domain-containing protein [Clostridium sp. AM58-1XD]|uniref:YARHG domain-containing protein n=1 Tax=Clostridium sp. AM58-1XD TaxID=2292307 RepID=UPI000E47A052|nr:YARHG domain-containing protein [Clostridium sp. AM58-1XD]RGZ00099.1 YARHG domain-containing protein [Clostridium sp. AM58-1XD]
MFCKECGKQIPDQVKFCPYCGAETQPAAPKNKQPLPPSNSPKCQRKKPVFLIIGLAVFFLIAVIAAAALILPKLLGKKSVSSPESPETVAEAQVSTAADPSSSEISDTDAAEDSKAANVIPPNSAEDDGNLFGNSHCYARVVSDGTYLYFRNALDKERTYWIKKGDTTAYPFSDVYMKDLHFKDGWIYYSRTTEGDIAAGTRDNNIYRLRTDASGNTNLTNLAFDNPQSWLSFETMAGGRCFFVYTDGNGKSVDIGFVPENGGSVTFLARTPAANVVDNPCINVIGNNVYYLAKDGLHCVDINTMADTIVIPGFSCEEYIIYDGVIYFWTGERQGEPHAKLSSIKLDNTDRKDLFVPNNRLGFSTESMQFSIYQGNIYFILITSYAEEKTYGRLYKINLDGSDCLQLMDDISWFNIIDDTLYYRYIDTVNSSDVIYQYAPYYYAPFQSVESGNGTDSSNQLFNTEPFKSDSSESFVSAQFILPDSDKRILTEYDISGLSEDQIRLARNEIYARHGRKFTSQDLNEYFSGQPWYQGTIEAAAFNDNSLNEYERANINILQSHESSPDKSVIDRYGYKNGVSVLSFFTHPGIEDCGTYYKVQADYYEGVTIPAATLKKLKPGDTLQLPSNKLTGEMFTVTYCQSGDTAWLDGGNQYYLPKPSTFASLNGDITLYQDSEDRTECLVHKGELYVLKTAIAGESITDDYRQVSAREFQYDHYFNNVTFDSRGYVTRLVTDGD